MNLARPGPAADVDAFALRPNFGLHILDCPQIIVDMIKRGVAKVDGRFRKELRRFENVGQLCLLVAHCEVEDSKTNETNCE